MPRKIYDEVAPYYDRVMRPLERWALTRLRVETFKLLPRGARILEIGAGTGRNFAFYPADMDGVASEPSGEMLRIANTKPRPNRVRLVQGSAEQLPFKDDSFDAAVATLVFCSVSSPQQTFTELRRVVKPGGVIVLLEHVRPTNLLGPLFDLLNLLTVPLFDDHFNRRTAHDARAAGLKVLGLEKHKLGILNVISCRVE